MPRQPKPDFLVQYEEWMRAGPPKCCHKCEHYDLEGRCTLFDMEPPLEFVNSHGQCKSFSEEVPF